MNEVRWFTRMILAAAVLCVLWADMARAQDITVVNRSAGITDVEVAAVVPALQTQITRDLAPIWGASATLRAPSIPSGVSPPGRATAAVRLDEVPGAGTAGSSPAPAKGWTLTLTDTGPAFALGYHDVGRKNHRPFAIVNIAATSTTDVPWTVVASHELLEMLVDPWINLTAKAGHRFYYVEVADPVEADWYDIDGVTVSDFVTPAWYTRRAAGPYDFLHKVHNPFQLLPGGYTAYVVGGSVLVETA